MIDHTIRAFDTDLQKLADKIAEIGRLDGEQIADAIDALVKGDTSLAERVMATDDRIDALQHAIEEKAVATITRRQPMAVDLREIVGALRISNDLERVGDLAENIAKRALHRLGSPGCCRSRRTPMRSLSSRMAGLKPFEPKKHLRCSLDRAPALNSVLYCANK